MRRCLYSYYEVNEYVRQCTETMTVKCVQRHTFFTTVNALLCNFKTFKASYRRAAFVDNWYHCSHQRCRRRQEAKRRRQRQAAKRRRRAVKRRWPWQNDGGSRKRVGGSWQSIGSSSQWVGGKRQSIDAECQLLPPALRQLPSTNVARLYEA